MLFNCSAIDLFLLKSLSSRSSSVCRSHFSNNNRRFNNNYNQRGGGGSGGDHFQHRDFRGGDFQQNPSNYNNNRYQNGDSDRGGNWNNRGGSRTFSRSSGAEGGRFAEPQPGVGDPIQEENGGEIAAPIGEQPTNTRWQEPPQQEYNNRSGGGFGGRWNQRGGEVDYTVPGPRDERVELELFGTANTGINFNKYEDIPVEATGQQVPEHIASFEDIKLTDIIRENVKMARYDKPTPVQKYAIPIILGGRDLMSCAQTGSG